MATTQRADNGMEHRRWYRLAEWSRLRARILSRDAFQCRMCGVSLRPGRKDSRSAVVDHIRPHAGSEALFWDAENLWSVCKQCHDGTIAWIENKPISDEEKAQAKRAYKPLGSDGFPVDAE